MTKIEIFIYIQNWTITTRPRLDTCPSIGISLPCLLFYFDSRIGRIPLSPLLFFFFFFSEVHQGTVRNCDLILSRSRGLSHGGTSPLINPTVLRNKFFPETHADGRTIGSGDFFPNTPCPSIIRTCYNGNAYRLPLFDLAARPARKSFALLDN